MHPRQLQINRNAADASLEIQGPTPAPATLPPLMTGRVTYRVDAQQLALYSTPARDGSGPTATRTGTKTADLEITIDLDKLRDLVAADAMRTKHCNSSRLGGAIRVRAIDVRVKGEGRPL